jgi:hypothetical protein
MLACSIIRKAAIMLGERLEMLALDLKFESEGISKDQKGMTYLN